MLFTEAGSKPLPRACQNKHTRSVSTKNATSSGNKYTAPPPLSVSASIEVIIVPPPPLAADEDAEYPNLDNDFPFCFTTFASFNFLSHIATAMLLVDAFRCLDHAETNKSNCSFARSVVFTLNSSLVGNFASGFSCSRSSEYFVALAPPLLNKCDWLLPFPLIVVVVVIVPFEAAAAVQSMVSNLLLFSPTAASWFSISSFSISVITLKVW